MARSKIDRPDRVHGTSGGYKRGCRCDHCISAMRSYQRDLYWRRKRGEPKRTWGPKSERVTAVPTTLRGEDIAPDKRGFEPALRDFMEKQRAEALAIAATVRYGDEASFHGPVRDNATCHIGLIDYDAADVFEAIALASPSFKEDSMTADRIRAIAQSDPTSHIVERWGAAVIEARKRVHALEDALRELDTVTGQLKERDLVVATDLGVTGNAARHAFQGSLADAGAHKFTLAS